MVYIYIVCIPHIYIYILFINLYIYIYILYIQRKTYVMFNKTQGAVASAAKADSRSGNRAKQKATEGLNLICVYIYIYSHLSYIMFSVV